MKVTSIRSRILLGVGVLQLSVAALTVFLVIWYSQRESLAAFDANLASRATSLLALVQVPEEAGGSLILQRELLKLPATDRYRLTDARDNVIAETPEWRLPAHLSTSGRTKLNLYSGGNPYRALVVRDFAIADPEEEERLSPQHVTLVYGAATTEMDDHLQRVATATGLACLVMLGFSLAATFWIVRVGLRPLDALAAEASSIDAVKWDFDVPTSATGVWELRPLAAALSHLVSRLKAAFDRERQLFGDAAHELKTAVAIVKSTLQLALQVRRPAEEYRQGLVRALDDTDRLEQLVLRMLQLAAIEGPLPIEHARTDSASAIASVVDQFATLTQTRGIQIHVNRSEPHCIDIPEQEFRLLTGNLIENAIQHSHSGQHIEVISQNCDGTSELVIRDYGPGIPADVLPHIFERFFRTDQSRSRTNGGFGLGLAIVHAITVKYRGTVAVHSAVHQGTTVTVHFPSCMPCGTEEDNTLRTRG